MGSVPLRRYLKVTKSIKVGSDTHARLSLVADGRPFDRTIRKLLDEHAQRVEVDRDPLHLTDGAR